MNTAALHVQSASDHSITFTERIQAYEKSIIFDQMKVSQGILKDVCQALNIPRKTLYEKMKGMKLTRFKNSVY